MSKLDTGMGRILFSTVLSEHWRTNQQAILSFFKCTRGYLPNGLIRNKEFWNRNRFAVYRHLIRESETESNEAKTSALNER